jgi:hypothetical protein
MHSNLFKSSSFPFHLFYFILFYYSLLFIIISGGDYPELIAKQRAIIAKQQEELAKHMRHSSMGVAAQTARNQIEAAQKRIKEYEQKMKWAK